MLYERYKERYTNVIQTLYERYKERYTNVIRMLYERYKERYTNVIRTLKVDIFCFLKRSKFARG